MRSATPSRASLPFYMSYYALAILLYFHFEAALEPMRVAMTSRVPKYVADFHTISMRSFPRKAPTRHA